jgi:hypothetical protein
MSPGVRKFALTVHLTSSVGWIGAVAVYLALGVAAVTSPETQTIRAAWTAMEVTGWWVIVPLAIAALLTGLMMSLGTHWGLFRHYWVLISLGLTVLCTVVLVVHMPTVTATAPLAQTAQGADLRALGGDLFHPAVGLLVLLAITVLNVYKPAGVTPYGWRKQRNALQQRAKRSVSLTSPTPTAGAHVERPLSLGAAASRVGYFVFHFGEMLAAMMLGMAAFVPFSLALTALGDTALLDARSIDFQIWMGAFMVTPMALWMRLRGCRWREGAEMSAAMLLPVAAVVVLRRLGASEALPWLSSSEHTAMLVGMLALMLYQRERYASGYSFIHWPSMAGRRASRGQPEEAPRRSAPTVTG